MKYAHIEENGKILGWYDKNIHASIQTPNIEISDDIWQIAINNNHNKVNADGTTELYDFRTDVEKAEASLAEWKASRTEAVANIKVTIDTMEFDGDEISQTRMARAIVAMNDTDTTIWVLANNTPASVTKAQLTQALKLSGEAQTALWVMP